MDTCLSLKLLKSSMKLLNKDGLIRLHCRHINYSAARCTQHSGSLYLQADTPQIQHERQFLPNLPFNPFNKEASEKSRRLHYSEQRVLGWSQDQMYTIVAGVQDYQQFVPWCKQSTVYKTRGQPRNSFNCTLCVGFPPILEKYTSIVTVDKPNFVRSECNEGILFNHLLTIWRFSDGIEGNQNSCTTHFSVDFEFKSLLHSQLATMFFDEVVKNMVHGFIKRAYTLYGPESITPRQKKVLLNTS